MDIDKKQRQKGNREQTARFIIYYNLIAFMSIFLLLVLLFFQSIWVLGGDATAIVTQVCLQQTRVQLLTKDVLVLASYPSPQAVNEMQNVLPVLEQVQAGLQNGDRSLLLPTHIPSDVQAAMLLTKPDYLAIDTSAHLILSQSQRSKPVDPVQIAIILDHENDYSTKILAVRTLWIQHIDNAFYELYYWEVGVTLLLIVMKIIGYLFVRKIAQKG